MDVPYPSLTGVITNPKSALDRLIRDYFYADGAKHGINLMRRSFRKDINGNEPVADNVKNSLDFIISRYFPLYTISCIETNVIGTRRFLELTITITDDGTTHTLEDIVAIEDGALAEIIKNTHL